jgi:hypothetical protein
MPHTFNKDHTNTTRATSDPRRWPETWSRRLCTPAKIRLSPALSATCWNVWKCRTVPGNASDVTDSTWRVPSSCRRFTVIRESTTTLSKCSSRLGDRRKHRHDLLVAEVLEEQAILLRHVGRTGRAIPLLRKTVAILAKGGPSPSLASTQAVLGEALVHNNLWDEARQGAAAHRRRAGGNRDNTSRAAAGPSSPRGTWTHRARTRHPGDRCSLTERHPR